MLVSDGVHMAVLLVLSEAGSATYPPGRPTTQFAELWNSDGPHGPLGCFVQVNERVRGAQPMRGAFPAPRTRTPPNHGPPGLSFPQTMYIGQ